MSLAKTLVVFSLLLAAGAQAQTLVVVPAYGEVTRVNDEATLTLGVEEQDKDKNAAASRVNSKMKQGMDIVRKADPLAKLQTQRYYTYPVYPEDVPGRPVVSGMKRVQTGWRVSQSLDVKTTNLAGLAKTAGAAQGVLQIERVRFGLSAGVTKQLDDERIGATYRNLTERVASIARAMGQTPADATIETVDFEGSGNYAPQHYAEQRVEVTGSRIAAQDMAEPSFEPGETTLQMRVVGKVKFR